MNFIKINAEALNTVYWNNSLKEYLIALLIFLLSFIFCKFLVRFIEYTLNKVSHKLTGMVKIILATHYKFYLIILYIPIYLVAAYLTLPIIVESIISKIGILVISFTFIGYISKITGSIIKYYQHKPDSNKLMLNSIRLVIKLITWIIGILLALSNLGVNITTLIAGLGVGGMAFALASKEILADLFNYFIIAFEKPFNIGHTVTVGGVTGKIKSIGLRGTRLISNTGEELIIANTEMTKSIVKNFTVMDKRRVLFTLKFKLNTAPSLLRQIPALVEDVIVNNEHTEFNYACFCDISDYSYNFEISYFVTSDDYNIYVNVRQEIFYKLVEKLTENRIELAIPSILNIS